MVSIRCGLLKHIGHIGVVTQGDRDGLLRTLLIEKEHRGEIWSLGINMRI